MITFPKLVHLHPSPDIPCGRDFNCSLTNQLCGLGVRLSFMDIHLQRLLNEQFFHWWMRPPRHMHTHSWSYLLILRFHNKDMLSSGEQVSGRLGLLHCSSDYSQRAAPLHSGLAELVSVTPTGLCCLFLEQRDICHPHWALTDATFKEPAPVWTQKAATVLSLPGWLRYNYSLPEYILLPGTTLPTSSCRSNLLVLGVFWRLELKGFPAFQDTKERQAMVLYCHDTF